MNIKVGGDIFEDRMHYRKYSSKTAYIFAINNISANSVTLLSTLLIIIGCVYFSIPNQSSLITLLVLNEIGLFLDCIDGQLARYYKNNLKWGWVLDNFTHVLLSSMFLIAFSIRVYLTNYDFIYLVLGSIGVVSYLLDIKWLEVLNETKNTNKTSNSNFLENIKKYLNFFDDISARVVIIFALGLFENYFHFYHLISTFFILNISYNFASKTLLRTFILFKNASK